MVPSVSRMRYLLTVLAWGVAEAVLDGQLLAEPGGSMLRETLPMGWGS
jgi:hypothetical protein